MKPVLVPALFLLLGFVRLFAQSAPSSVPAAPLSHVHTTMGSQAGLLIDGAQHPEEIPDSAAYRLFFIAAASNANPSLSDLWAFSKMQAHNQKLGLNADDAKVFWNALRSFKDEYDDLIKAYNDEADSAFARGGTPDYAAFLKRREAIVEKTRNKLTQSFSPGALTTLNSIVQSEKRYMKALPATTDMTGEAQ